MASPLRLDLEAYETVKTDNGLASDSEFARAIGISPASVSLIKNGKRGVSAEFLVGVYVSLGYDLSSGLYVIETDDGLQSPTELLGEDS